jgi:dTDP-4-amino-4,6-dideoxygalactose transaminase
MINDRYFLDVSEADMKSINDVLSLGQLSGKSMIDNEYEIKLANYFNSSYAISISSGSAALHCALYAAGIRVGDDVIMPATAPIMSAMPVLLMKANIIFADTNANNFGFDVADVEAKITSRTKALITVPMWGYPFEMQELCELCKANNISIIEDAAQSHGTKINDLFMGTIGRMGCFSTHDRKILPTGEGGFILTDDPECHRIVENFKQLNNVEGKTQSFSYRLSALQSAIGYTRIDRIEEQILKRTLNADFIKNGVVSKKLREIWFPIHSRPNYYSLVLQYDGDYDFVKRITKEMYSEGIPSDILRYSYKPMYEYPLFAKYASKCPNTEHLTKSIFTVCVHPGLLEGDILQIIEVFNKHIQ